MKKELSAATSLMGMFFNARRIMVIRNVSVVLLLGLLIQQIGNILVAFNYYATGLDGLPKRGYLFTSVFASIFTVFVFFYRMIGSS